MNSNQILDRLHNKYYVTDKFSDVTSAHWKKYGEKIIVQKSQESYDLKGYGFGNRQRRNVLNGIKNIPQRLMFCKILRDNNANHKTINAVNKLLKHWNVIFGFSHFPQKTTTKYRKAYLQNPWRKDLHTLLSRR